MIETMTKPKITAPLPEGIPKQMTRRPQWIVWKLELRGEKWTKVPYCPGGGPASHSDLMTWRTFPEALSAYAADSYDGIGFVFSSGDPYVGIDLDKCRDPETGIIEPWAQKVIDGFTQVHVEASPSGTGLHIIAEGELEECMKIGPVEMYDMKRFFTMTGVGI
jgi:putative DNA primase/helicase